MSNPFRLDVKKLKIPAFFRLILRPFLPLIERTSGLSALADVYDKSTIDVKDPAEFSRNVLDALSVDYEIVSGSEDYIPESGPTLIVANHPFGGIEALMMIDMFWKKRKDVKFLANYMLSGIEELKQMIIYVDPFESQSSARANIQPLREAVKWLQGGGALIVFPAGAVSHLHLSKREICDPEWNESIGLLAKKSKAKIMPVFIHGRNSVFFQIAGLIHPLLRTLLIPRQGVNKKNRTVPISIGKIVPYEKAAKFKKSSELTNYLRLRAYVQKYCHKKKTRLYKPEGINLTFWKKREEEIMPEFPTKYLKAEIATLPTEQVLVDSEHNLVAWATKEQIPCILQEIGRLREITFREVGEGTGKTIDLDSYDEYYAHLFAWDKDQDLIMGAYRLGNSEEIIRSMGVKGLYTWSLFDFNKELFDRFGPSLEMGRSFVRLEYQRTYRALLLLWQGIAKYAHRHPENKILFGPVSISKEYKNISRQLLISYLRIRCGDKDLGELVQPRHPFPQRCKGLSPEEVKNVVMDLEDVSDFVSDIENLERDVPILLREYLKLGGKILEFNVDPDFSDVVDGFIYVDLTQAPPKALKRYMGKEEYPEFIAYHSEKEN